MTAECKEEITYHLVLYTSDLTKSLKRKEIFKVVKISAYMKIKYRDKNQNMYMVVLIV